MKLTNYFTGNIMRIEFEGYIPNSKIMIRSKLQWTIVDNVYFSIWEKLEE